RRLCQRETPFWETNAVKRFGTSHSYWHGLRVGEPHVLTGEDEHTTEEKARVFASVDHFGEPVHGGIRMRAAQGFNEGGDGIVVIVALFVIQDGALLDAFLGHLHIDHDHAVNIGGVVSTASSRALSTPRASPLATCTRCASASGSISTWRCP